MEKEKEMFYYYLKHENGVPYGCVAFTYNEEDNTINRGVSVCSVVDKFVKNKARGLALQRHNKAVNDKETVLFNSYVGSNPLKPNDLFNVKFNTKYGYHVQMTEKEHRILFKPEFV